MARPKNNGLRRPLYVMTRLNASERARLNEIKKATGLSLQEYGRCRLLYIPFEAVGGKEPPIPSLTAPRKKTQASA